MKKIALLGLVSLVPALCQEPKFDLADVHISKTPRWFAENYAQNSSGVIREGRYIYRDATLLNLIQEAYSVTNDMVAGPAWLKMDIYDVIAKVPEGTTPAAAKGMLQALLAERFALVARHENRPMPRFVLSVSKSGSKLKPAAAAEDSGCKSEMAGPMPAGPITAASLPNQKMTCHNLTSAQIVENLRQMAGGPINTYLPRDVVDATGLPGKWDFDLEFTQIGLVGDKGKDGITLFDAVSKQLGLTLELKDVPVPALVVASVNRNPTPNPAAVKTDLALATARFEVVAVKPVNPDLRNLPRTGLTEMRFIGNVRSLVTQAFMLTPNSASDVILGLPKSADAQVWDVVAKLPSSGEGAPLAGARPQPPPRSVVAEMLRGMLADQFGLKTHSENREVTVYAMTLPGKPKMTQADGTERTECPADPLAVKPFPNMGTMVACKNITMAEFAENLNQATGFFDHPIVDETGLKGGWNFKIGWSRSNPIPVSVQAGGGAGGAAADATEPTGLTSYEAVERQMGVRLVKQKRSIPVIVVDHVEEKPIE